MQRRDRNHTSIINLAFWFLPVVVNSLSVALVEICPQGSKFLEVYVIALVVEATAHFSLKSMPIYIKITNFRVGLFQF